MSQTDTTLAPNSACALEFRGAEGLETREQRVVLEVWGFLGLGSFCGATFKHQISPKATVWSLLEISVLFCGILAPPSGVGKLLMLPR